MDAVSHWAKFEDKVFAKQIALLRRAYKWADLNLNIISTSQILYNSKSDRHPPPPHSNSCDHCNIKTDNNNTATLIESVRRYTYGSNDLQKAVLIFECNYMWNYHNHYLKIPQPAKINQ